MAELFARKKKDASSLRKESESSSNFGSASKPKKKPQIRVARTTFYSAIGNKFVRAIGFSLFAIAIVYICFVITIMRVVPTTTAGLVPVKNITFTGGMVPAGEEVLVSMGNPQGSTMLDYLRQAFLPTTDASVVRVEAGPWGSYSWAEPGIVTVKGEVLDMGMPEKPEETILEDSYLVTCIEGACIPGEGFVIPKSHIMGEPLQLVANENTDESIEVE